MFIFYFFYHFTFNYFLDLFFNLVLSILVQFYRKLKFLFYFSTSYKVFKFIHFFIANFFFSYFFGFFFVFLFLTYGIEFIFEIYLKNWQLSISISKYNLETQQNVFEFFTLGTGASKRFFEVLNAIKLANGHPKIIILNENQKSVLIASETTVQSTIHPHLRVQKYESSEIQEKGLVSSISKFYLNSESYQKVHKFLQKNQIVNNVTKKKEGEFFNFLKEKKLIIRNGETYNRFMHLKPVYDATKYQNTLTANGFDNFSFKILLLKSFSFMECTIKDQTQFHKMFLEFYKKIFKIDDFTKHVVIRSLLKFEKTMLDHIKQIQDIREETIAKDSPNIETFSEYIFMKNILESKSDNDFYAMFEKFDNDIIYAENNEIKFVEIDKDKDIYS